MTVPSILVPALNSLVHELVAGNYARLESDGRAGRLTARMLGQAVAEYGHILVDVPNEAFEVGRAYAIKGESLCWAVDLPLWTVDEGRSDLTLQVTARSTPDGVLMRIDDLHVL